MNSVLDRAKEILGGDTYSRCESASLRLEKFVHIGSRTKKDEINAVVSRRPQLIPPFNPKGAVQFAAKLGGRLIVNQAGGVLEKAGLCLHPHFNAPYIPGSALKGIARHAAWEAWNEAEDGPQKEVAAREVAEIFGYPTGDKGLDAYLKNHCEYKDAVAGTVCFMPAYPVGGAPLVTDVLTPHGGNDWTDPIPSPFPAVEKGAEFRFNILPVMSGAKLSRAEYFLKRALTRNGVGAKSNAGYGHFVIGDYEEQNDARLLVNLSFASPAFLRGMNDEGNLRIPTLRGLARWWWRWLFRSVLSERDLKLLEAKVWGGCSGAAKASCLSFSFAQEPRIFAVPYDKNAHIPKGVEQVRTKGLVYLSYGMDEISHGVQKRRKVLEVNGNNQWLLVVKAASRDSEMSESVLLLHAKLALWALCNYGGVGSRSRKGFGSLCSDIHYEDINAVFADIGNALVGSGVEMMEGDCEAPYALVTSLMESVQTSTTNHWLVLDRVGYAIQQVASEYKHDEDKAVLGLPRQIHGPRRDPMPHQRGRRHQPPLQLRADSRDVRGRFAAPLAIHLERNGQSIKVNLTAFPSDIARSSATSEQLLGEVVERVKEVLATIR